MLKVFFKTFGCRSNVYDTQVMISNLKGYLVTQDEMQADIIVINSCTVTNKADREVRSYARKHSNLGKKVIFTGCGVKHLGSNLFKQNIAFSVFSHSHKEDISHILTNTERIFLTKEKIKYMDFTLLPNIVGRVRAFIKIQEGCDFACSYCVIPSVRGRARSFQESHIIEQIRILAQNNVSEIILTGTNIGSYGIDTKTHIAELIAKIHEIEGIRRIRLGSLEPSQIDSTFLEILNLKKLEKHLHIALQHTSPTMLRIMNRKNTFEKDLELFQTIASKGFSLGTDYIIGHHGESELLFQEAVQNLKKLPLTHIHPFIYSPRIGTKSAINAEKLESVRGDVAKRRLKYIQKIVTEKNTIFRQHIQAKNIPLHILIDGFKELIISDEHFFNRSNSIHRDSVNNMPFKESAFISTRTAPTANHKTNNSNLQYTYKIACYTGLDQYFNRMFIPYEILEIHSDIADMQIQNIQESKKLANDNFLMQLAKSHAPRSTLKKGDWITIQQYSLTPCNIASFHTHDKINVMTESKLLC